MVLLILTSLCYGQNPNADSARRILYYVRLPRTIAGILCGAALAGSGLILQEALNNPLASPAVLGVNNGAGFFALLAGILLPGSSVFRSGMSFLGALTAILLVYGISRKAGLSRTVIILSGVAVSALMSAGINAIITFWPDAVADKAAFTLGGLSAVQYGPLVMSGMLAISGFLLAFFLSGGIDLFRLGDETAMGLGLNVRQYRILAIVSATVLAGAAVCVGGLISFLGLIIPNLIRRVFPEALSTAKGLSLSMVLGSDLLLFSDFLARRMLYPYELPVGLLLSMLGAPFFIWMLMHRRRGL